MKRQLWLAVVIFALIIAVTAVAALARKPAPRTVPARVATKAAAHYACPMHPEVTSATRGKCPKCGLLLAPTGR